MQKVTFQTTRGKTGLERAEELFRYNERNIHLQTDRLLAKLMLIQWIACIAVAFWISPRTWIGSESLIHWHVWGAIFLGGAIASLPVALVSRIPGRPLTRHCLAAAQILFSSLLIHLTGGRIETHFHVFGSLAFLSFYRDWRVLVTASVVVAADHALRGMFWPQSVFGVLSESPWRWLEHAGWVLFEDFFLLLSISRSVTEMREAASRRSNLEISERRLEQAQRVAHVGSWEWDLTSHSMVWSAEQFRLLGLRPEKHTPSWDLLLSCTHTDDLAGLLEWSEKVRHAQDFGRFNFRVRRPDGQVRILGCRGDVVLDDTGRVVRVVGICQDITERQRAEDLIRVSELKFRSVTQSVGEAIISADRRGRIILWNRAAESIFGYREDEVLGKPLNLITPVRYHAEFFCEPQQNEDVMGPVSRIEWQGQRKDGSEFPMEITLNWWSTKEGRFQTVIVRDVTRRKRAAEALQKAKEELEVRVAQRTAELTAANRDLHAEVLERQETEAKLEALHKQLLESSRQAGMAEVATSVLHNVGNVLNSVNISCSIIAATVRKSGLEYLSRTAATLQEQGERAGDYVASHPVGQKIPGFLGALAQQLQTERTSVLAELETLGNNIDHIKEIVAMQQNYGKVSGVTEIVRPVDLVEDSMRMNAGALKRHEVTSLREFGDVPAIKVEKHKVLQILVNVIRNAKYACDESGRADKQITFRVEPGDLGIRIVIADNGVGIPQENLTRIFSLGFTTRKEGHGYGLHSAVLAAQELGGRLSAHSDGPGRGATFTLDLPLEPPTRTKPFYVQSSPLCP